MSRFFSIFNRPAFPDPALRLSESAAHGFESASMEIKQVKTLLNHGKTDVKVALFFRNFLCKTLLHDDSMREKESSLFTHLSFGEKETFYELFDSIESRFEGGRQALAAGMLWRMSAAVQARFGIEAKPLLVSEGDELRQTCLDLRMRQAKHLACSVSLANAASQLGNVHAHERMDFLDQVCPLHIGISTTQLRAFIAQLPKESQNVLLPLLEERSKAVLDEVLWKKLVSLRYDENQQLQLGFIEAKKQAKLDAAALSAHSIFARLILRRKEAFIDDFYRSYYLLNFIPLLGYFNSPHISALFDEQHLNKQMKAAGESLFEDRRDPQLLRIMSSLSGSVEEAGAFRTPFNNVYIPDDFQSMVRAANLRHLDSSCQVEHNQVYYLPEKGLSYHNPLELPEDLEALTPFFRHRCAPLSFSPVISYSYEGAVIKGTHAFLKLTNAGKTHFIGKFSAFPLEYDQVKTYWLYLKNILPNLLGDHPAKILNPDQNLGYEDRRIAQLKNPLILSVDQINQVYQVIHAHQKGEEGRGFTMVSKNCTALPEEILRILGVNLPSRAPLHALLEIGYPKSARAVKWLQGHPKLFNALIVPLAILLGSKAEQKLSAEAFDVMTPYVLRIYIELKNCVDQIRSLESPLI